jgi:hypothetical protein
MRKVALKEAVPCLLRPVGILCWVQRFKAYIGPSMTDRPGLKAHVLASTTGLDIILCAAIGLATGGLAWILSSTLSFTITNLDVWFDTDSLFIFDLMTDRSSLHHGRNAIHPLFGLLTYPLVFAQKRFLGIDKYHAALPVLILSASLWASLMYATLRVMRRPPGAALIFTLISISCTAGLLFLGIYERHLPGSITILLCVAAFVAYERRLISGKWLTVSAAATLGITITNFMVGIAALFLAFGRKKGLQASINAFFAVGMLSVLPLFLFPNAPAFLNIRALPFESTRMALAGTLWQKTSAFWLHSMVMPEPQIEAKPAPHSDTRYLSLQRAEITKHRPVAYVALTLWLILLGIGMWKTYGKLPIERVDILLGLAVVGHFCLFLVFGTEAVLYSPTYMPLILLMVSRLLCYPTNIALYVACVILLCFLVWNNIQVFLFSRALALSLL